MRLLLSLLVRGQIRKLVRTAHLWLGLIAGLFFCLMGVTGALVALRPQIAMMLAPSAPDSTGCRSAVDWDRAASDISAVAHSEINRIYGPYGSETRWHFRMTTDQPVIYKHVIFDACSGKVLGLINLAWMDWTVDLHHNLLAGRTGRVWGGFIGIVMLVSSLSGLLLWLLAKPKLNTAFQVNLRLSPATWRQLHRAVGIGAAMLLGLEAFTGLFLCFPQTMRGMVASVSTVANDVRPARGRKREGGRAGLNNLMAAAHNAIPDGFVREIRMPEGNGNVQVRMWRPGDFRSLGNNVVYLSAATAEVLAVDRYADEAQGNRLIEAMAGLHYDEWGGLPFRVLEAVAGFATLLLMVTGFLIYWSSRARKAPARLRQAADNAGALTR